jgi:anthranilate synthase component 2
LVEQCGITDYLIVKNDFLLKTDLSEFDKVLISPGPGIAAEAGDLMEFLKLYYKQKSILGVCLGYEAIGELFGARLTKLPLPLHGVQNNGKIIFEDKIFKGLPQQFKIGHYHSWIINEEDMPDELTITLVDEEYLPMAMQHIKYELTGLQFHPESIMTEFGKEMICNWLNSGN